MAAGDGRIGQDGAGKGEWGLGEDPILKCTTGAEPNSPSK